MKKLYVLLIIFCCILLFGCSNSSSENADWSERFIVWNGNMYVVSNESIDENQLGEEVGEINAYSENEVNVKKEQTFSNFFPEGATIHKIVNIDEKEALIVKDQDNIKKVTFNGKYGK